MKFALVWVGLLCAVALCQPAEGSRLVVDDFSISQVEERNRPAGFSNELFDSELTFGSRQLIAVSDSPEEPITAVILDGVLHVNPGGTGVGSGGARWPSTRGFTGDFPTVDLSAYHRLEFDVTEVIGEVQTRVAFVSFDGGVDHRSTDLFLVEPGRYSVDFPEDVVRSAVYSFAISSRVDRGEEIILDNVWLVVPEPSSLGVLVLLLACGWPYRVKRSYPDLH